MIDRPVRTWLLLSLLLAFHAGMGQYLPNPSFEGISQPHVPPPGWAICTVGNSTPDTQPGQFGVFLPPSHGNTYLGMTARDDFTWEDVHSVLDTPLSVDSCYIFRIDLAYQEVVNGLSMLPITVKVYGHNTICNKTNMLWQSPAISNEEWETHEFPVAPTDYDITDIVLEAYYNGTTIYWGYILIDNIHITHEPKVDLGNDTTLTLCEDGELILNAGSGYAGYVWSNGSGDSTITVDTTGSYWVQVMNQYGCTASDTIEVTIEEYEDMVPQMLDSTLVCQGQQVTISVNVLNGAEPYSYLWPALGDTTATVTFTVDSTAYFVVQVTDNCDNVVFDSIKMVVAGGPDIDLGEDLLVCYGEEVELAAGGGYSSYLWQDGSQDSVYVSTSPGWFWVTVTDIMGCTNTDSIFIEYYAEVIPDLGNDTVMCQEGAVLLDPGAWVSYQWFDGSTGPTRSVSQPGVYWVTVEDVNGCFGSDTITVELSPAVLVSLGGDTTVCSGDNYILAPGSGFTSYLWQDGSTGPSFPVTVPGTYWVQVTDVYGCSGGDTVTVGINPSPQVSLGSDTVICTGTSLVLDPGSQYSSYLWQDNSSLPVFTVTTTGFYTVTVTNIFDCPATDEVYVEVTSPDIELGPDTILCLGDTLFLDPGAGYPSYLWQDDYSGAVYAVTAGGIYSVTVTDEYSCTSEESVTIESLPVPYAELGPDQVLCTGDVIQLVAPEGPYTYFWNGQPGAGVLEVDAGGTYAVEVSNQCGTATDQIAITEIAPPQVDLGPDIVLEPGEVVELDAGAAYDQYLWQDGSTTRSVMLSADDVDQGISTYWVEVWDGPCKNSDTLLVEVFRVKVPMVITPNGDGINDTFTPMADNWSGISRHHIEVFNRWGEKVWESDDFESGWDGKKNGSPVAEGTYFWVLEVHYGSADLSKTFKGTLTILGAN